MLPAVEHLSMASICSLQGVVVSLQVHSYSNGLNLHILQPVGRRMNEPSGCVVFLHGGDETSHRVKEASLATFLTKLCHFAPKGGRGKRASFKQKIFRVWLSSHSGGFLGGAPSQFYPYAKDGVEGSATVCSWPWDGNLKALSFELSFWGSTATAMNGLILSRASAGRLAAVWHPHRLLWGELFVDAPTCQGGSLPWIWSLPFSFFVMFSRSFVAISLCCVLEVLLFVGQSHKGSLWKLGRTSANAPGASWECGWCSALREVPARQGWRLWTRPRQDCACRRESWYQ